MKVFLFLLVLVFVIFDGYSIDKITHDNLKRIKNIKEFQDIMTNKTSIVLEGVDDNFFNHFSRLKISDEYIVATSQMVNVYVWDYRGTLIGKIGKSGKGPGEFKVAGDVIFIGVDKIAVHDAFRGILSVFKKNSGTFVYDNDIDLFSALNIEQFPPMVISKYKDGFVGLEGAFLKNKYRFYIMDNNFKPIVTGWKLKDDTHDYGMVFDSFGVNDKYIYMTDLWKRKNDANKKLLYYYRDNSVVYLYDFSGKLIKKIKTFSKNEIKVFPDRSGKVLNILDMESSIVQCINIDTKKEITRLKFPFEVKRTTKNIIFFPGKIVHLFIDENKKVMIDMYDVDFGL